MTCATSRCDTVSTHTKLCITSLSVLPDSLLLGEYLEYSRRERQDVKMGEAGRQ